MYIAAIDVYRKTYPLAGGPFTMSGGRVTHEQDSTIVRIETDDGLVGWGEHCAFSPNYLVGYGDGARTAMTLLAPALLALDPRQVDLVQDRMNATMKGHAYAKSALDIACWDILGKATRMPVSDLLGGTFQETFPLYLGIGIDTPERMVERCQELRGQGFRRFQLKVGTGWREDVTRARACVEVLADADAVIVDANGYWSQRAAQQAVAHLDDLDVHIEQPCATITECAAVRRRSRRPFALDESISDQHDVLRCRELDAADALVLKLSRFGGITPLRRARDLCLTLGLSMTIEDSGGGGIVSAATAHLTASVPATASVHGFLASTMIRGDPTEGAPQPVAGHARVPQGPGLGIEVDDAALGDPVTSFRRPARFS